MKGRVARTAGGLLVLLCALGAGACTVRTPLELDAQLASAGIDKIVVLPVIDARADRFDYVSVGRNVAEASVRFVRDKGYQVSQSEAYGQRPAGPIDIDTVQAEALAVLAPEDVHAFLLVQIERMDRHVDELGASYSVRLSGLLVDRDAVQVLWRDTASATSNLTGVLTVMSRGSSQYEAAVNAARALFETLPASPGAEPRKKRR